ncbi:MAG: protein translocase subunit SecD [Magnetococcales bacterium]|nr:protein translocase subunit SecD [Magnetococcales bacterium]MBF0321750.1 protein translocase subunit SecD [Magnetococcales bacterium]
MRQLPLWKPLLVLAVTLISLLYCIPSMLGGKMPSWWPGWFPSQIVHRGLDLQGGIALLYRVEIEKAVEQTTENLIDEIRVVLRTEHLGHRSLQRIAMDTVELGLGTPADQDKTRQVLAKQLPNFSLTWMAEKTAFHLTLTPEYKKEVGRLSLDQAIETIRSRVDQFGVTEPTIQKQGEDRIMIQLPGLDDPGRAKGLIGRTARLEFKMVDEKGDLDAALAGRVPPGDILLYGEHVDRKGLKTKQPYLLKRRTVLAGDRLTDARASIDQNQYNEPYVMITFDRQGARKFGQLTGESVGQRMAIVLDNKVYSAPVIREKIDGGRAHISGSFTPEEAHDLAIVLRAGALPAPITILEERSVGPTLGNDSIRQGLAATWLGCALVLLFMGFYYKGFGMLANIAVIVNLFILMAALAMIQATLTMPGIAGAVLLLGISVDANVLIFERIREELRLGKNPMAAIDYGYDRAFITIIDSHITTLVTALVLYQFGTGAVRGFAVTLIIGLVASMFTAVFMTRVSVALILKNRRPKTLSI